MPAKRERTGYHDVAAELRRRITTGYLAPGAPMPSEVEIRAEFGVSRITAGRALEVLRSEGLIYTRQRRGSIVRAPMPRLRLPLDAVRAESASGADHPMGGYEVEGKTTDRVPADTETATRLQVPEGSALLRREFRLLVGGIPLVKVTSYLPWAMVDGTPLADPNCVPGPEHAREQLALIGKVATHEERMFRVRMPTEGEAKGMKIYGTVPVFAVTRVLWVGEQPVEAAVDIMYPGDRVELYHRAEF